MAALPVLGWKEEVSLPEWGVERLRAKLDTGARSSALHVEDLEEIGEHHDHDHDGPLPVVRFHLLVGPRGRPRRLEIEAPIVGHRFVRDTRARTERRPVVRTRVTAGPLDALADVTLTDRSGMNFRMLLGRLTLERRCVVDPSRGYIVRDGARDR